VIGGVGLYDAYRSAGRSEAGLRGGVSAGAGIAVSVAARLRVLVEARYHDVLGATTQPPWIVPITIGVRF
jgi:hypothetical protein